MNMRHAAQPFGESMPLPTGTGRAVDAKHGILLGKQGVSGFYRDALHGGGPCDVFALNALCRTRLLEVLLRIA
jgi:hypothetical protein